VLVADEVVVEMSLFLGCIADDITGATDLANTLVATGFRVVQSIGVPEAGEAPPEADAIVVSMKTRSIEPGRAVAMSLAAAAWLHRAGAQRYFFKYCSTFDSTDRGNIGPVAEALAEALDAPVALACPAFPENNRTVYLGHLFVGDRLLSESGMEKHPLNPMTDANLVRVLQRQTRLKVGLLPLASVRQGSDAILGRLDELQRDGVRLAIADAIEDGDLRLLAEACADHPLLTGGSGLAIGLGDAWRSRGLLAPAAGPPDLPAQTGPAAVLAGSCSMMTLRQIEAAKQVWPWLALDIDRIARGEDVVRPALEWALPRLAAGPVLIYSSETAEARARRSVTAPGEAIERVLAGIACGLVDSGVRRLVVAGGETAGAVMDAAGIRMLRIGPKIAPGVPWTETVGPPRIALALKSGNFGDERFFMKALEMLP
jgi:3-dehydrotetronate 4-kinase